MIWARQKANPYCVVMRLTEKKPAQLRAQAGLHPSLVCQDTLTVLKRFWRQSVGDSAERCRPVRQILLLLLLLLLLFYNV